MHKNFTELFIGKNLFEPFGSFWGRLFFHKSEIHCRPDISKVIYYAGVRLFF